MKGKKFVRLMAFAMSMLMLLGSAAVVASAASSSTTSSSSGSTGTGTSLAELKELLNAISYEDYVAEWFDKVKPATESISVNVTEGVWEGDGFEVTTRVDGDKEVEVLYTPADGKVTWTINVPETARYALKIEYYPDTHYSTSIERTLSINGKVPFSEARYLTLAKSWVNSYCENFAAPEGMTLQEFCDKATEIGFEAAVESVQLTPTSDPVDRAVIHYPAYWTSEMLAFADEYGIRFFQNDYLGNELRPSTTDDPKFMTFYLKDSTGFYQENFELVFEAGENTITLEGRAEPMSIKSITLEPYEGISDYDTYVENLKNMGVDINKAGTDSVKLEAEAPSAMSHKTVYPVEDRSCAINSPTDVTRTVLNTMGGEKWATVGQWAEYTFRVNSSGMYDVVSRFRQNILDGMYTCRALYVFSDGADVGTPGYYDGAPFSEALRLEYEFGDEWQVTRLSDGRTDTNGDGKINSKDERTEYSIYLEAGVTYTIRLEVVLGSMGEIISEVQEAVDAINAVYLQIIQLTGTSPDSGRDYGFNEIMPDVMVSMVKQSRVLEDLADRLTELSGKSSNVSTLETTARLLKKMGTDEDEIAGNLSTLKSYVGSLGTFLSDAQTQPLQLDYILIQPAGADLPEATPSFFQSLWHEIVGFFMSFSRDYNNMGALEESEEGSLVVWIGTARDQFQITRNLVNYSYTGRNNIAVDLKLVAGGALLPSILSGSGPDVSLDSVDVINYAIRSAILNIEDIGLVGDEVQTWEEYQQRYEGTGMELLYFSDYALEFEVDENFNTIYGSDGKPILKENYEDAAFNYATMVTLGISDADNQMHYYGLPSGLGFSMMFVRTDILADLDLEIPTTWDELMACIPTLQANNMEIGLPKDSAIFIYQSGGSTIADDGMRTNLDSELSLSCFDFMCNLFTMYSFPYSFDAANRFRSGEMPIILGSYTGVYNQLKVFATELEGKWMFVPLPGTADENGNVNFVETGGVSSISMIKNCKDRVRAWTFMQWYTDTEFQVDFANEMIAILGPSAKSSTANRHALAEMPWTVEEYTQIKLQFDNLTNELNYPGFYIVGRYSGFAFTNAYTANADPATEMLSYISTINKEINRKRLEFDLETLTETLPGGKEVEYKNLTSKRFAQVQWLAETIRDESDEYDALMEQVLAALRGEDEVEIGVAQKAVQAAYEGIENHESIYNNDRIEIMGYDSNDRSLTKAEREKVRKCFIYEVYKETENNVTRLYFMADFLSDICRLYTQK